MKILHFIFNLNSGGKERQLVELLKGIKDRKNIRSEIVLFQNIIHYKEIHDVGVKIHILSEEVNTRRYYFLKLFKICREVKPDVIHAWGFYETQFAILPAKLLGIKLIHFGIQYGIEIKKLSKLWLYGKLTFPFSDMIIANSKAGLAAHKLNESSRTCFVYNGFDLDRISMYQNKELEKELKLGGNHVIGMVANFTRGKDQLTLIKGVEKILKTRKDIVVLFVGDGPTRAAIEERIQAENKSYFRFLGRRNDVEEILKFTDIGVLLAKAGHAEGISNSIMEYMAFCKPAIATNIGGNRELILEDKTGFLIQHHDVDALVEKLILLLNNSELRLKMGNNGHRRIKEVFNLDKMVENFVEIYNQLLTK